MKFEVLQEQFIKGLTLVSRAVSTRPQLPVLSNILFEAKADGIYLSATDLELGIRTKIVGKVEEQGIVTVPSRMVADFVGSLLPGKVSFELKQDALFIKSGNMASKIQTISADEFPGLPLTLGEESYLLEAAQFAAVAESVIFASAKDSLRPVLTGVLLAPLANSLKVVATDGFRLGINKVACESTESKGGYLVPFRAILEVCKLEGEGKLKFVVLPGNQVAFDLGDSVIVSQLIEGNYPEYQKIVPKEFLTEVTCSREELLQALKAVYIFGRDNSNMVKWVVTEEGIGMRSESPERGEASAEVSAKVEGDGGEIVFNAKFVLEFLQSSKAQEIWFGMSDNLAPGAFCEVGNKDLLYIVMPINA